MKEFSAPSVLSFPWSSLWVCCPGCCIALIYTSSSSLSSKEFLFLLLRWSLLFLRVPSEVSWFYPWCLLSLGIVSQHKFFGGNQVDLLGGMVCQSYRTSTHFTSLCYSYFVFLQRECGSYFGWFLCHQAGVSHLPYAEVTTSDSSMHGLFGIAECLGEFAQFGQSW